MANHIVHKHKAIGGFTLMELVIVIIAFGIISTISVAILRKAGDIYYETVNREAIVSSNRVTLWRMMREISLQKDKNNLEIASGTELQLVTPREDVLKYDVSGNKVRLTKNQGSAHELAENVVSSHTSIAYMDSSRNALDAFPLSAADRQKVMLINLEIQTALGSDILTLKSAIFPKNLRYGEIMPYHE